MNNYKDFVVVNITLNATIPWIHPHHFGDHGKRKKAAEAKICSEQQDDKDAALEDVAEAEEEGFEMSDILLKFSIANILKMLKLALRCQNTTFG